MDLQGSFILIEASNDNLPSLTKIIFSINSPLWINKTFFFEKRGMKFLSILNIKSVFLYPLKILKFFIVCWCIANNTWLFNEYGKLLINILESQCNWLIFLADKWWNILLYSLKGMLG